MNEVSQKQNEIEKILVDGILAKEAKKFDQAAAFLTAAIIESQENDYPHGVLHGLLNYGLIWKLKARETHAPVYANLSHAIFTQAVSYATENSLSEEEVMGAKYLLGQAQLEMKDFTKATATYQGVYDFYKEHPRSKAHLGDVQRHLGVAIARGGDMKRGIETMESGLELIRAFDEKGAFDNRNYVWETGALIALAYGYASIDKQKAVKLAQEALTISQREKLVIRIEESEKVLKKVS